MKHLANFVFGVIIIAVSALPASASMCDALEKMTNEGTQAEVSIRQKIGSYLEAIWGRPAKPSETRTELDLAFTNASGFSVRPVCEETAHYRAYLYYPIGLVVRRLGTEELSPNRKFVLVEAEHGLKMYIRDEHLQPLERDKTYIFANSLNFVPYCLSKRSCPEHRGQSDAPNKKVIHPTLLYALASGTHSQCRATEVTLFKRNHDKVLRKDGHVQSAYLDACVEDPVVNEETGEVENEGWSTDLKIVRSSYYENVFRVRISGHYQRFSDNFLSRIVPLNTSTKLCNEKTITEIKSRVGAEAKAEINIYVFQFAGKGGADRITNRIRQHGEGLYIFYSTYSMDRTPKKSRINEANQRTSDPDKILPVNRTNNPIEAIFSCDDEDGKNLVPDKLYLVNVHNGGLEGGEFSFYTKDFIDELKRQKPEGEQYDDLAGLILASRDGRKLGQFWKITGYFEYFRIRDAFRSFISEHTKVPELVDFDAEKHEYDRNIDYFTHLLIAATAEPAPKR